MYTKNTHSKQGVSLNQQKSNQKQKTHGDVWQDNNTVSRVRAAFDQPVTVGDTPRTQRTNNNKHRSQKAALNNRLYQVAFWTEKPIREQILHIAKTENLSISQATNALVKYALRQKFHEQQAATLPAIIQQAVSRSNRKLAARLVSLLIRIAFDSGQTRVIATNILGRQPGMTEKNLKEVLQMGDKRTKANLTRRTAQVKELEETLEKFLLAEEEEDTKTNKEGRGE